MIHHHLTTMNHAFNTFNHPAETTHEPPHEPPVNPVNHPMNPPCNHQEPGSGARRRPSLLFRIQCMAEGASLELAEGTVVNGGE